ncbi:MAG: radical SAM protein [Deltaproteobacteria bacterium]|nr:radical SAM protein [Deltaproteobacteria bacterium]
MIPAKDPETFSQIVNQLRSRGALGVLVSGGANRDGEVPLEKFVPSIKEIKEKDPSFKIIVHTGLIKRNMAKDLKDAGVDQILLDMIGDEETIREVYHLDRRVEDYEETLSMLKEIGHRLAPHIIIGHHFGEIRGEWRALEIITRVGVETIVLVILKPLIGKDQFRTPTPEETSKITAIARILNPKTPIRMGCIRPAHPSKVEMEKGAIDSGVNTIAYPLQGTIEYAKEIGLEIRFIEMCCSLI